MAGGRARDSRSVSQDGAEDSGSEYHNADNQDPSGSAPGKPGRKKNPNSQAARRDQNRIAQREFRLRKQQRIRDLEARLEILSGTQGETFSELREIIKDLMKENMTLRNLVRGLSNFIGDGAGGILPKLGFDRPQDFMDFVNKAETDTAFEGFQKRKKAASTSTPDPSIDPTSALSHKRQADGPDDPSSKRARTSSSMSSHDKTNDRYGSLLVPMSPAAPAGNFYSSTGRSPNDVGLFTELLQGQNPGSGMYLNNNGTDSSSVYVPGGSVGNAQSFNSVYHPPVNVNVQSSFNANQYMPNPGLPLPGTGADDNEERPDDPKVGEAQKLIHYHLDNYKRNNAYCLPQSLRPTLVQRTVPHESVIDGVVFPELRDRMILLRGRFDLVDCLMDLRKFLVLHGDDVLAHTNWEITAGWLRRFGFLVDQPVLNVCNRWRRERGEPELSMADIAPAQSEQSPNQ